MKKSLIVLLILAVLALLFFIPVKREQTIVIKAPFLKVYKQLLGARNWANWNPEVKKDFEADSAKVTFMGKPDGYAINSPSVAIDVKEAASVFTISQQGLSGDHNYLFAAVPDKKGLKTMVGVVLKTNLAGYVWGMLSKDPFEPTHINNFKNYIENDSLYYGYRIYKIRVPQADLLVIRKLVPKATQFTEAATSFADLTKFITDKHLKKTQPVIAQFIPKGADSVQVNVGFFIDKEIRSTGYVTYVHMPKNGPLVVIDYKGKLNERGKAYAALNRYFTDHTYQSAVLPFETYFNDKLPRSESEQVDLRINYTSFQ